MTTESYVKGPSKSEDRFSAETKQAERVGDEDGY